jgi:UDP-galactopyranose mutase
VAKSRVGETLYDKLFKNYTFKQWNKYPNELDKSVLERIPVRYNFDNRYFNDKYQGLPENGYTNFINNMLNHQNITIKLNTDFFEYKKENDINQFDAIIYTGPIDNYFNNLPKLEYRSINFEKKIIKNMNYFQINSVINYPSMDVSYTRIVEYKYFLNQKSNDTIIVHETTTDKGEPFYPVPNTKNLELYEVYKKLALEEEKKNVFFLGRLANYKYINMDQAIENSLFFFNKNLSK